MNLLHLKWTIKRVGNTWREEHVPGLVHMAKRCLLRLTCYPQIRSMNMRHALHDAEYDRWFRENLPDEAECETQNKRLFSHAVSYLIPTYNTDPGQLLALADSLIHQTCGAWEACFYDGASQSEETLVALKELTVKDSRFHVFFGKENAGISGNTNKALFMAHHDYVALCDHDDLLAPDCTYWFLDAAERGADFIYSDEDKVTEDGKRFFDPHLKADFSPDALRSGNYICHLMGMRTDLLKTLGGLDPAYDGSQDHDLALRATEVAHAVAHIPRVLYHWRMVKKSYSHSGQEKCADAAARAIDAQIQRLHLGGKACMRYLSPYVTYDIPENTCISVIVHSLDGGFDPGWLKKILKHTHHTDYIRQIFIVGQGEETVCCHVPVSFCASADEATAHAQGNMLLFVEQGICPVHSDWLERLLMFSTRPWLACAGGGLVDKRQNYVCCGYAVSSHGKLLPRFYGDNRLGTTYQLYDRTVREVTAVSSSLLMIRKSCFLELGGFAEYKSDFGAVALGVHAIKNGYRNVIVPEAVSCLPGTSVHYEPVSQLEARRFAASYRVPAEHDYSPLFEQVTGSFQIDLDRHDQYATVITQYD